MSSRNWPSKLKNLGWATECASPTVTPVTALYDACVLYPAPLRDLLMWLALTDLFRARWTDRIHDEWIGAVLRERPELKVNLERTRAMMNAHVRDCLVTGYEPLIEALDLPDPDDRHVLAAAIAGRADLIVTKNLQTFPPIGLCRFISRPDTQTLSCEPARPR